MEDQRLTNAELMSILNHKTERRIPLTAFEYFVYRYHETQAAAPLFRKRRLLRLAEVLGKYDLTKDEMLMIANYPPETLLQFWTLVDDCGSRFPDDVVMAIIAEVRAVLAMELDDTPAPRARM